MSRKLFIINILFLFAACMTISCNHTAGNKTEAQESHDDAADKHLAYDEIIKQSCEHNKPIIECAECRYKAGVVKVDKSLLQSSNAGQCFIETQAGRKEKPVVYIEAMGEVQPDPGKIIAIRSKITGVIGSMKTDIGARVKPGDILLSMDSNEFRELHQEFFQLSGLLKLAEKNYEREERLFQKKLTTEKDYLEAKSGMEKTMIELDTIRRKLQLMGMNIAEVGELPKHSELTEPCLLPVRSPIAGTVIERKSTPGALVEANEELMTIADLSTLWIWINVYEKDLRILQAAYNKSGVKAELSVESYPHRIFNGTVDYIADTMDEHTRTIKARIILNNSEGILKIGMFVQCRLSVLDDRSVLMVPGEAMLKDGDTYFVFKQVGEGLFFKQEVVAGEVYANGIEVKSGLKEDEVIVVRGAFTLKSDVLREKMGAGCAD
ncbi:MAG: hypothetical protein A2Y62_04125 [Candidatus Fischerbacteria bacterium RBG_13_37_8]|uniref:Uncharacterized protein n=1 Tax=Candidatus Fischerbacteria bacterium RBG_13_37_8 TaxID=1817863 RepID=A0A1F5V5S3_9BACT|nr:MAG: hypothetical protein A2Y62_04125 [Candidatus Fischerbacteria bacterium RBG_13_37_8]